MNFVFFSAMMRILGMYNTVRSGPVLIQWRLNGMGCHLPREQGGREFLQALLTCQLQTPTLRN